MTIQTHNGYLLVEVPGHSTDFDLDYGGRNVICMGEYVDAGYIETPPGPWDILGLASSLSDKDWDEIVERVPLPLAVYWRDYGVSKWIVESPTASGLSLLESMNLKPGQTIVLKKVVDLGG